jgi:oxygen-dependent protoporphyrinogen oxidase
VNPVSRVAILGGGICGLSAAFHLLEEGGEARPRHEIRLYEKSKTLGGVIRTEHRDGFVLDLGPDALFKGKPAAADLARRLGLASEMVDSLTQPMPTLIYQDGMLHPLPEGLELMAPTRIMPLLKSRLISVPGKLRMMMEPFISRSDGSVDESIAQFARRRFGQEALDKIAGPLMAGIHAGDPEQLSISSTFPRLVGLEQAHGSIARALQAARKTRSSVKRGKRPASPFQSFRKGMITLVDGLAARLKGRCALNTGVSASAVTRKGSGYGIAFDDGSTWDADAVIVALPAAAASALLQGVDAGLSEELLAIPSVSTAAVYLGYEFKEGFKLPPSTGFLVPEGQHQWIFGCSFVSKKFPGRAPEGSFLLRIFMGGALHEKVMNLDDDEMIREARSFLAATLGLEYAPSLSKVQRWPHSNPQYVVGHQARVARVRKRLDSLPGLHVTGSALMGVGVPDGIALGAEAAQSVMNLLQGAPVPAGPS